MSLAECIGKGYVIEHYIAFFKKELEEKSFKIYVSDALKLIAENTSRDGGKYMSMRFIDVIEPHVETRTADDIITNVKNKIKGL